MEPAEKGCIVGSGTMPKTPTLLKNLYRLKSFVGREKQQTDAIALLGLISQEFLSNPRQWLLAFLLRQIVPIPEIFQSNTLHLFQSLLHKPSVFNVRIIQRIDQVPKCPRSFGFRKRPSCNLPYLLAFGSQPTEADWKIRLRVIRLDLLF